MGRSDDEEEVVVRGSCLIMSRRRGGVDRKRAAGNAWLRLGLAEFVMRSVSQGVSQEGREEKRRGEEAMDELTLTW
jgi:hypothetical protein